MSHSAYHLTDDQKAALDEMTKSAMAAAAYYVVSHMGAVQDASVRIGNTGSAADVMLAVLDDFPVDYFTAYHPSELQNFLDSLEA